MKGRKLTATEIENLKIGTKIWCEWDNWIGKGEGVFVKDHIGIGKIDNTVEGFSLGEIYSGMANVFEYVEPVKGMTIYTKAIEVYGPKAQIDMAIEEMSELTQALCKFCRGRESNVEEEIADVEIMVDQLKLLFCSKKVSQFKQDKLKRLASRIESELTVTLDNGKAQNGISE